VSNSGAAAVVILGVLVIAQVFKGRALQRMGLVSS
jgi:hypothetical protein